MVLHPVESYLKRLPRPPEGFVRGRTGLLTSTPFSPQPPPWSMRSKSFQPTRTTSTMSLHLSPCTAFSKGPNPQTVVGKMVRLNCYTRGSHSYAILKIYEKFGIVRRYPHLQCGGPERSLGGLSAFDPRLLLRSFFYSAYLFSACSHHPAGSQILPGL